ncbi:IS481 family transposase [Streptosporangium sp. NPDC006007]|uniref:IS481 family transposase n=1 Tax=Streptosporangium sp. NPDC006007 TaxID=3154575 RepID=UPI0033A2F336
MELSVMEQRYRAVLEVEAGCPVTEVAQRYGVSRQSVHAWMRRYQAGGLAGLADRSHRPQACPHQTIAAVEAAVCELRRSHPRWGPARLAYELGRRGVEPVPSPATLYRILVRNTLIVPGQRRRPRASYVRWERETPMELWQLDVMGAVMLADGRELKLISGIDDHSRFIVIAQLVVRASGRAVCAAFAAALRAFGVPDEVLTDNGKQFTGRFTKPRASEVLFERICRENGITARTTQVRSPTTTGKVERWHKTVREEFLAAHGPFSSLQAAQDALDAWVIDYNTVRPHQALDMAVPAGRFVVRPGRDRQDQGDGPVLALRLPAELAALAAPAAHQVRAGAADVVEAVTVTPVAVEVERVVPASGNLTACGRQVWLGTARAGQTVTVWASTTTMCVFIGEELFKTHPVTLSSADLGRLMAGGGRAGRPSPAAAVPPGPLSADAVVEVDRMVNNAGCVGLAGRLLSVGVPLAGQRVTLRIDARMVRVIADGVLVRTRPSPLTPSQRGRLHGARLAQGADGALVGRFPTVERVVSGNGTLMVAGCKVQVGQVHRGKVVTVVLEQTRFRVLFEGEELSVHPRTITKEVNRLRASGHIDYRI